MCRGKSITGRGGLRRGCGPSIVDDLADGACREDGGCRAGSISNHTEADAFLAALDLDDNEDKQLQLGSWRSTTGGSALLFRTTSASTSAGVGMSVSAPVLSEPLCSGATAIEVVPALSPAQREFQVCLQCE